MRSDLVLELLDKQTKIMKTVCKQSDLSHEHRKKLQKLCTRLEKFCDKLSDELEGEQSDSPPTLVKNTKRTSKTPSKKKASKKKATVQAKRHHAASSSRMQTRSRSSKHLNAAKKQSKHDDYDSEDDSEDDSF